MWATVSVREAGSRKTHTAQFIALNHDNINVFRESKNQEKLFTCKVHTKGCEHEIKPRTSTPWVHPHDTPWARPVFKRVFCFVRQMFIGLCQWSLSVHGDFRKQVFILTCASIMSWELQQSSFISAQTLILCWRQWQNGFDRFKRQRTRLYRVRLHCGSFVFLLLEAPE